jgi:hypothetical protein
VHAFLATSASRNPWSPLGSPEQASLSTDALSALLCWNRLVRIHRELKPQYLILAVRHKTRPGVARPGPGITQAAGLKPPGATPP